MNFIKRNLNAVFIAVTLIAAFIAVFQLSNAMERPIEIHSVNYHILHDLNGPAPGFYGGEKTNAERIEEIYNITYVSPKRFDIFVRLNGKDEETAIMGLRDGRVLYLLPISHVYFTIYDASPPFWYAVKATDIKETPDGVVMVFDRDWPRMLVIFAALSTIFISIVYIVAAVISQQKE